MADEFSATCGECNATGTGSSYDEAESNIRCAKGLNDHGICRAFRHTAQCNGQDAYEITRAKITLSGKVAKVEEVSEKKTDKPQKSKSQ